MAIKKFVNYYCDMCESLCSKDDGKIYLETSPPARDVGARYVHAHLLYFAPYAFTDGLLCKKCKISLLKKYIELEESKQ